MICLCACSDSDDDGGDTTTNHAPSALFGEWTGSETNYGVTSLFSIIFRSDGTGYSDFTQPGSNDLNRSGFSYSYNNGSLLIRPDGEAASNATIQSLSSTSLVLTIDNERYNLTKTRTQQEVENGYKPNYSSTLKMFDNTTNFKFSSGINSKFSYTNFVYVFCYNGEKVQVRFSPSASWVDYSIVDNGSDYDPSNGKYGHQYSILLGTSGNTGSTRSCQMYIYNSKDEIGPITITQEGSGGGGGYNVTKVFCYIHKDKDNSRFDSFGDKFCYKWVDSSGNVYLCTSATDFSTRLGSGTARLNTDTRWDMGLSVASYKYRVVDYSNQGYTYYYYFD